MRSLEEMVSAGLAKLRAKADSMKRSWDGAKPRMKAGYDRTPFGPTRKANFGAGIDRATFRVDPEKWGTNWPAKMRE